MKTSDFYFDLPDELIAQLPVKERSGSRLLLLDGVSGVTQDLQFRDLIDQINANDLLVFNNTRVIPARLYGHKSSGGKVEVLVERIMDNHQVVAHVRASKSPKAGSRLTLEGEFEVEVLGREDALFLLQFPDEVLPLLQQHGHMPLPPYIDRDADEFDSNRYQTVYATKDGAVAAPTAGLHFDDGMMQILADKGIAKAFVTLHVGAGTFQPVRVESIADHKMHSELVDVDSEVCNAIAATRKRGGRVIAVGTTVVRSLESAARDGELKPYYDETDIFITPGYRFNVVDSMITNFHLPESTLLMLVSAFSGVDAIKSAYAHAILQGYRFFSYGDAMFLQPHPSAIAGNR